MVLNLQTAGTQMAGSLTGLQASAALDQRRWGPRLGAGNGTETDPDVQDSFGTL